MCIISKIRNFYLKERKKYCIKQYRKYLFLVKIGEAFYFFAKNFDSYPKNKYRYSILCKKYKDKALFFSKKLNKIRNQKSLY